MLTVAQVGPARDSDGGMAAVLRHYSSADWESAELFFVESWHPHRRLRSLPQAAKGLALLMARRRHVDIVHVHLSERGSFIREGAFILLARLLSMKTVATIHGAEFPQFTLRHRKFVSWLFSHCDRIVTLGPRFAEIAKQVGSQTAVVIIPNPQPVPLIPSTPRPSTSDVFIAGEVGRRKGVDRLLQAWPKVLRAHPDARLLIAGPPGDISISQFANRSIVYLGNLAPAQVLEQINRSTLCCLPSREEVLPMFALESLASGCPIVATPVGEMASLVDSGGVVLTDPDATDLHVRLIEGLTENTALRERAEQSPRWVEKHMSASAVAAQLQQLYDEVMVK